MNEFERLIFKLQDENYKLTTKDIDLLTISAFVLAKERIIKKDIDNKKIYFDCNKKVYTDDILELGNKIKNIIVADGKPLHKTVSVELLNSNRYFGDLSELEDAVYYVHRLRDWFVHKDYEVEGNKLLIKPFEADTFYPDLEYTIELNLSDIKNVIDKNNTDFMFESFKYKHVLKNNDNIFTYKLFGNEHIRLILNRDDNIAYLIQCYDNSNNSADRNSKKKKCVDLTFLNPDKNISDFEIVKQYYRMYKYKSFDVYFKFNESYSNEEFIVREMIKEMIGDKLTKNSYYIAALYNFALNVYAEREKDNIEYKYLNICDFKLKKVDNNQYKQLNESIIGKTEELKDYYNKRVSIIADGYGTEEDNKNKLLNIVKFINNYLEKYLETQKNIIIKGVRNSIDHGNVSFNLVDSTVSCYDMKDNRLPVNKDNSDVYVTTSIKNLYDHIKEYNDNRKITYSFEYLLNEVEYILKNREIINILRNIISNSLKIVLDRDVDLSVTTMDDVIEEFSSKSVDDSIKII